LEETLFPLLEMIQDPTVQAVLEGLNLEPTEAEDLSRRVASIKVSAVKPLNGI